MLLMGESINGTRKQVAEAIQARDAEFIKTLATDQVEAGAGLYSTSTAASPAATRSPT